MGDFEVIDVKANPLSINTIDELARLAGGYEVIFNKQSRKYREHGLAHKELGEQDYRQYLSQEYTFLKRPVFVVGRKLFAGNNKKNLAELIMHLKSLKAQKTSITT
ncbi:hypothetical protein J1N11_21225 [Marinilabiliaceae bacterium N1Y90]|nr:hypothetical protein [Marinilabiliaceae bacterium N1Y90]